MLYSASTFNESEQPSYHENYDAELNSDDLFLELDDTSFYNHSLEHLYQESDEPTEEFTELDPSEENEFFNLQSMTINIGGDPPHPIERNNDIAAGTVEMPQLEDEDGDDLSEIDFGESINDKDTFNTDQCEGAKVFRLMITS